MRTKSTLSHSRRGISTIMGTLIFIGILFTAYIPMQLVMKQADNIYERRIHEMKTLDDLKTKENLMVYAYSKTSNEWVTVFVQNRGVNSVEVVRIWLNDEKQTVSENIASSGSTSFGPFFVDRTEVTLSVKVTTANGNIFTNTLGITKYDSWNGWYTPSLGICVTIINKSGQYEIKITTTSIPIEVVGEYKSQGLEHDDIIKTFLVPDDELLFNVEVKKKVGGNWINLYVVNPVQVPAENGRPIVDVVVDGTKT